MSASKKKKLDGLLEAIENNWGEETIQFYCDQWFKCAQEKRELVEP
jgi:hypothetical protein